MKKIVCDASSLISLGETCMLNILPKLAESVTFLIPKGVKNEVIDHPLKIPRFAFQAMTLKTLLDSGVISVFDDERIAGQSEEIMNLSNSLLSHKGRAIKIIQLGESDAMAALNLMGEKALLIDERTTRHLIENPPQLKEYMEHRTKMELDMDEGVERKIRRIVGGLDVVRSAELVAYAYENDLMRVKGAEALSASLYALKFAGCSITDDEIRDYARMIA